jgi:hypothetical protein
MDIRAKLKAAAGRRPVGNQRFGLLLIVLAGTYVLSASVSGALIKVLQIALFLLVVLIAARSKRVTRQQNRVVNAVVLAGSAAAIVLAQVAPAPAVGAAFTWIALMLLLAVVLIVSEVLTGKEVTLQSIFGAISAYLVIGLMFSAVYAAITQFAGPPFFANGQPGTAATFQYFSFTTLTTVGYGDFTAASGGGRAVAVMEAVLGQVFLAVLVGWLVSAFHAPRFSQGDGKPAPPGRPPVKRPRRAGPRAEKRPYRHRPARPRSPTVQPPVVKGDPPGK